MQCLWWKRMEAIRPDSSLLKLSLSTILYSGETIVQHAELVVGEDGGQQRRLLPTKAQPRHYPENVVRHNVLWERIEANRPILLPTEAQSGHNPANRGKYSPVCSDMKEDKGQHPRLLPAEGQPRQNPAHRGIYSPAGRACGR